MNADDLQQVLNREIKSSTVLDRELNLELSTVNTLAVSVDDRLKN
jgi:hypothetical protein